MLRHSIEKNYAAVTVNDFKVIARNYRNNVQKRKVVETVNKPISTNIECRRTVSCFKTFKLIYRPIITCSRLTVELTKETSE